MRDREPQGGGRGRRGGGAGAPAIDRGPVRALFSELVQEALERVESRPSPQATSYLVELLETRVRAPQERADRAEEDQPLGVALLSARLEAGRVRARRLRSLGDRALFAAGFFGDSLNRSLVDLDYYGAIGRSAYGLLSRMLDEAAERGSTLFEELAADFGGCVDVLAEVADRARREPAGDLLRVYERYVRTGSARERARLIRRGVLPLPADRLRRWQ